MLRETRLKTGEKCGHKEKTRAQNNFCYAIEQAGITKYTVVLRGFWLNTNLSHKFLVSTVTMSIGHKLLNKVSKLSTICLHLMAGISMHNINELRNF